MALQAAADDEQQFTMRAVVETHRRFMDLPVVYTNDPVWEEHSIHIMELLLVEEKYKVVEFDLEYTRARAGSRPKVAVAQMCVRHPSSCTTTAWPQGLASVSPGLSTAPTTCSHGHHQRCKGAREFGHRLPESCRHLGPIQDLGQQGA